MMTLAIKAETAQHLIKQRFFWPGMDAYIRERVRQCEDCIKRKTPQNTSAELLALSPLHLWKSYAWTIFPLSGQRVVSRIFWL